jgi:aryl-alcohol dehydrogenase-like predicted oxidoreductase
MDTRTIGSLTVSVIGLGCNNFGMRIGRKETDDVVGAALEAGITLFDTADVYGGTKSEEYLGAALGSRRDEIVLATKFGVPYEDHAGGGAPAYVRAALEDSLRRLGTDHVDLYQLHLPDKKTPIADTLGVLAELQAEGKVREFGCSNFDGAMLEEARAAVVAGAPGFVSVQNQYNVLHRDPEDDVLAFCDRTQTAFLPYFPLASGVLSGKYRAGVEAPEGTRMAAWGERAKAELSDERLATVAALDALAQSEGHTVLDLAFAWLLAHGSVASVIAGATRPGQVTANVAAGQWQLSSDVLAQVDAISPREAATSVRGRAGASHTRAL